MNEDAALDRLLEVIDRVASEIEAPAESDVSLAGHVRGYRGPEFVWEWSLGSEIPRADVTVTARPSYFPNLDEPPRLDRVEIRILGRLWQPHSRDGWSDVYAATVLTRPQLDELKEDLLADFIGRWVLFAAQDLVKDKAPQFGVLLDQRRASIRQLKQELQAQA